MKIWSRNLESFCWKFLVHRSDQVFSGFRKENRDQLAGVGFWNKWPTADRWLDRVGRFLGQIRLELSGGSGRRIGWTALANRKGEGKPLYVFVKCFIKFLKVNVLQLLIKDFTAYGKIFYKFDHILHINKHLNMRKHFLENILFQNKHSGVCLL